MNSNSKKSNATRLLKKIGFRAIIYFLIAYVTLLVYARFFCGKLVYYPTESYDMTPNDPYETVEYLTSDKEKVTGWFFPVPDAKWTILFMHGNAGNISHRLDTVGVWSGLGCQVLLFDYRGYGKSSGKPNEPGTYVDAAAMWTWLTEKKQINAKNIIIHGRSLGGAIAVQLCRDVAEKPAGLILESTFMSIGEMSKELFPFFPVQWALSMKYDSIGKIGDISIPKLIIHSKADEIIPYSHGQSIFEKAKDPKTFLEMSGSHNYGFLSSHDVYRKGLRNFLIDLSEKQVQNSN